jgi:hypothetical protein
MAQSKFSPNRIRVVGKVAYIYLNTQQGKIRDEVCIIDSEDIEKIKPYKWHYNFGYCSSDSAGRRIQEVILGVKTTHKMVIDHKNGDGLDNRKSNLRYIPQKLNLLNSAVSSKNTSGYKGVSYNRTRDYWEAYINFNGQRKSLGHHKTKEEAVKARIVSEEKYHGEYRYGKR